MNTKETRHPEALPPVDTQSGVPTFVFEEQLREADQPRANANALEVLLLWGDTSLGITHVSTPRPVTIGRGSGCDFQVPAEGFADGRFNLLEPEAGGFAINWTRGMELEVRTAKGDILDADSLRARGLVAEKGGAFQYKLGLSDCAAVQMGRLTFRARHIAPAQRLQPVLGKGIDLAFAKLWGFAVIVAALFIAVLVYTPEEPGGPREDLFTNASRFAQLILKEPDKKPDQKRKFELDAAKAGGQHRDKEGKFGRLDKPQKDALASAKGAPRVDPNKRERDRRVVMSSGIFAALSGQGGAASDVFGPGGLGSGINQALGGLRGAGMGDAGGSGGLGSRGVGPGSGGSSLGIGGLGGGLGYGTGGGGGNVDLGGRPKEKMAIVPGRTITKGCLTSEVVMRVINRVTSQAKYCYEKELPRNPNLEGKVTTKFVIGPTGAVQSVEVTETTMNNAEVEGCITRVVQRLRFPPCAGGGIAEVTYPWIFKSGGTGGN